MADKLNVEEVCCRDPEEEEEEELVVEEVCSSCWEELVVKEAGELFMWKVV